jgi:cytochrome c biogenesis protein CcmG, thiol:disulfide interchange protein DsbE
MRTRTRRSRAPGPVHLGAWLLVVATAIACTAGDDPRVPDVTVEHFDGSSVSLADHAGEPLVINFFASWCGPCVAEMPDLEAVHRERAGAIRMIGVNTQDAPADARALVDETGVTYDLVWDPDGELFREFGVVGMPSTFLVDRDGRIVYRHAGILTAATLGALIDEHLGD